MFVAGFLGLCSAAGVGTATELTGAGYTRQPVRFGTPRNGASVLATPYTFGGGLAGPIAGRALYDAPVGGNLLLVLPFQKARPGYPTQLPDRGDVGFITLQLNALTAWPDGDAFNGTLGAGSPIGTCWDETSTVSRGAHVNAATGSYDLVTASATLYAGVGLKIVNGVLGA